MMRAEWVPFGRAATERLQQLVADAQHGDPLAPVTVVTPSVGAAIVLRRRLGAQGLAAVSFLALEQAAELLAARRLAHLGRTPIVPELVTAAVRVALAGHRGQLEEVAGHPATEERLAEVVVDLSAVAEHARRALPARLAGLPGEVAQVAVDALDSLEGVALQAHVFTEAATELRDRPEVARPLGSVIVHLPGRLAGPIAAMLAALAEVTEVTVLVGACGLASADDAAAATFAALGVDPPGASPPPAPVAPTLALAANDVDDEVRTVLRHLMALVDAGTPVHRIALLHPAGAPYSRAVADHLRAAGVPSSSPSTDALGATVAGRTLLHAIEAVRQGCPRDGVIDLVGQAPVLAPGGGRAPVGRWDRLSRAAGVIGGVAQWQERLSRHAQDCRRRSEEAHTDPERADRLAEEAAEADRLAEFVTGLAEVADAPSASWGEVVTWAEGLLDRLLGPVSRWSSAPPHEIDAHEAVLQAVARLGALARLEPAPTRAVVERTIAAALDAPAPRRTSGGQGMLVAPVSAGAGLDLDVVAVVGMVEGALPRPARESALLPDHGRALVGLPAARAGTDDQHRALLAALAGGAKHRILSWPRGDQRRGRTQVPSRWLIDLVEAAHGTRPRAHHLQTAGTGTAPSWLTVSESFTHGLHTAPAPLGRADGELSNLALHVHAGQPWSAHPLTLDPVLGAAARLLTARRSRHFTRFDGNLTGHRVTIDASRPLSPTSLETWATCPRRHLLGNVLGLDEVDRPERIHRMQPADVGTAAHHVLHDIVGEAIDAGKVPEPGEPWPPEVMDRVEELVDRELADLERRGRMGHPRYRTHDRRTLITQLRAALVHDAAVRADTGGRPVAVEMAFGIDGEPAVAIEVEDGRRLPFRGFIDRVDRSADGVHVYDYKTGSPGPYDGISADDPVHRGRKLQLGVYALAARERHGAATASAHYWFTREVARPALTGFELEPAQESAVLDVLRRIVGGIEGGVFPARPGEHVYHLGRYESCAFCDFDRICSPDRAEEWDLKRHDPGLADYSALAEGPIAGDDERTDG